MVNSDEDVADQTRYFRILNQRYDAELKNAGISVAEGEHSTEEAPAVDGGMDINQPCLADTDPGVRRMLEQRVIEEMGSTVKPVVLVGPSAMPGGAASRPSVDHIQTPCKGTTSRFDAEECVHSDDIDSNTDSDSDSDSYEAIPHDLITPTGARCPGGGGCGHGTDAATIAAASRTGTWVARVMQSG